MSFQTLHRRKAGGRGIAAVIEAASASALKALVHTLDHIAITDPGAHTISIGLVLSVCHSEMSSILLRIYRRER